MLKKPKQLMSVECLSYPILLSDNFTGPVLPNIVLTSIVYFSVQGTC